MTPAREAIVLPLVFLTVTLLGGLRLGEPPAIEPPTLFSLVLAMLLVATLVQSGTLAPDRLMNAGRPALANMNGLVVVVSAFAASAQVLTLVTPTSGLPAIVVAFVLLGMLVQMVASSLDRTRLLRGLMVTVATAFTLKFVLLAALSQPAGGRVARAIQTLFDNVTLGAIAQKPVAPADGYVAFLALTLYMVGLSLLPAAGWQTVRVTARRLPAEGTRDQLPE
jgi:hypothetical protein